VRIEDCVDGKCERRQPLLAIDDAIDPALVGACDDLVDGDDPAEKLWAAGAALDPV
jgi:hypothetical protein